MGMSKNNKQLIGMKILDDGVVEFLVKLKDRNEPEWVNFTDIDSNSLRPMLSALGSVVKLLHEECDGNEKKEPLSDPRSGNFVGEPTSRELSPIEIDTQQLISEFQKPWMLSETDTPAVESTDAAASKPKSEPRQMNTIQPTTSDARCSQSQDVVSKTQKENTGDAYLKIHKDMKNNLKNLLMDNDPLPMRGPSDTEPTARPRLFRAYHREGPTFAGEGRNYTIPGLAMSPAPNTMHSSNEDFARGRLLGRYSRVGPTIPDIRSKSKFPEWSQAHAHALPDLMGDYRRELPSFADNCSDLCPFSMTPSPTFKTTFMSNDGYVCRLPTCAGHENDDLIPISTWLKINSMPSQLDGTLVRDNKIDELDIKLEQNFYKMNQPAAEVRSQS